MKNLSILIIALLLSVIASAQEMVYLKSIEDQMGMYNVYIQQCDSSGNEKILYHTYTDMPVPDSSAVVFYGKAVFPDSIVYYMDNFGHQGISYAPMSAEVLLVQDMYAATDKPAFILGVKHAQWNEMYVQPMEMYAVEYFHHVPSHHVLIFQFRHQMWGRMSITYNYQLHRLELWYNTDPRTQVSVLYTKFIGDLFEETLSALYEAN